MRRAPRVDDGLAGDVERGPDIGGEARFAGADLLGGEQFGAGDAVGARAFQRRIEARGFVAVPRQHQRAGRQQRQVEAGADAQIFFAPGDDAMMFQRVGPGVETGVQNRGVGFTRAVEDVRGLLDAQHLRAFQRKPPRHRATDHAGTDDDDIECLGWRRGRRVGR